ncbi:MULTISPECIES: hypothetical protein [Bacillus cereus group]|uniref:hypothetical protein n=1 Tax=Bacillus cereus group TaxID=86661 RepID=UPI00123AB0DF|nr:hypothetical protein [Bacillus cereus]KAA6468910.1 hypothetical protein DX930_06960 [Bacillus cereus]KAA6479443.1 hypothetical protein DX931_14155 [Bacillus cereus]KAB2393885.1 hypothetical protein F8171_15655 [Bacillus cereus]KAB2414051.1 hypothetical protein F8169_27140 [Bacillus cereus]KAB2433845.1 hypothetical protein F8166_31035 [Bacillus cereus]
MKELPNKIIGLDQICINRGIGKICKSKNRKFVLDTTNKRVTYHSCGSVVDPYDAIVDLSIQHEEFNRQVELLLEQKKQLTAYNSHLRIIKSLESIYRGRMMLLRCPRAKGQKTVLFGRTCFMD